MPDTEVKSVKKVKNPQAEAFSNGVVDGIHLIRQDLSEEVWARQLTQVVITALTMIAVGEQEDNETQVLSGELTLLKLSQELKDLYTHPEYGQHPVTEGLVEDLARKSYLDSEITKLINERKRSRYNL